MILSASGGTMVASTRHWRQPRNLPWLPGKRSSTWCRFAFRLTPTSRGSSVRVQSIYREASSVVPLPHPARYAGWGSCILWPSTLSHQKHIPKCSKLSIPSSISVPLCSHEKKSTHEDTVVIRLMSHVRSCFRDALRAVFRRSTVSTTCRAEAFCSRRRGEKVN